MPPGAFPTPTVAAGSYPSRGQAHVVARAEDQRIFEWRRATVWSTGKWGAGHAIWCGFP